MDAENGSQLEEQNPPEKPQEAPLGPRSRKPVQFFKPQAGTEHKAIVLKEGSGQKLADIPNVVYRISKWKADYELAGTLHNLLFKRPGKVNGGRGLLCRWPGVLVSEVTIPRHLQGNEKKKNILQFSGFVFDDEEKEKGKLEERVGKLTVAVLNDLMDTFDIPRGSGEEGTKAKKVSRLVDFLVRPSILSEKDLAAKEQALKEKKMKKRERLAKKKAKASKQAGKGQKRKRGNEKKAKEEEGDDDKDEDEDEEESEEEDEEDKSEEEEETPSAKRSKPALGKKAKHVGKEEKGKGAGKKQPATRKAVNNEDEEMEDEGVHEEAGEMPTDEELKAATLAKLDKVDMESFTVKMMMDFLGKKFKVDVSGKKAFVKAVITDYVREDEEEEEGEEDDGGEVEQHEVEEEGEQHKEAAQDEDKDGSQAGGGEDQEEEEDFQGETDGNGN